jgi:hypothetical protein
MHFMLLVQIEMSNNLNATAKSEIELLLSHYSTSRLYIKLQYAYSIGLVTHIIPNAIDWKQ